VIPILLKIIRTGVVSEPAPATQEEWRTRAAAIQADILRTVGRALVIRQVDAGSCNGCELEIHALNNPYYNLEGLGIRFAASPRHADMLLVTGPVTRNMEQALRIAYEAMPDPKLVVAVGDCGRDGGIFGAGYATCGGVAGVIPVDVAVPGCPPPPLALLQGILTAISRGGVAKRG
jgi:Ni,Fe-hydrogenase III small subunit